MPGTQWFNIAQDRAAWCNKIEISNLVACHVAAQWFFHSMPCNDDDDDDVRYSRLLSKSGNRLPTVPLLPTHRYAAHAD
jgi:hypothetical protein